MRLPHRHEWSGEPSRPSLPPIRHALHSTLRAEGVGGVASGADAYAKVRAGASVVQLYSALAYSGPGLVPDIKADLAARLRADGFASIADAVGADHRRKQ